MTASRSIVTQRRAPCVFDPGGETEIGGESDFKSLAELDASIRRIRGSLAALLRVDPGPESVLQKRLEWLRYLHVLAKDICEEYGHNVIDKMDLSHTRLRGIIRFRFRGRTGECRVTGSQKTLAWR